MSDNKLIKFLWRFHSTSLFPPPPSWKANFFILIVSKNLPNKQKKKIASRVSNFGASAKSNFVTIFVDFRWGGVGRNFETALWRYIVSNILFNKPGVVSIFNELIFTKTIPLHTNVCYFDLRHSKLTELTLKKQFMVLRMHAQEIRHLVWLSLLFVRLYFL